MNLSSEEAKMLFTLSRHAGVTQADRLRSWIREAWDRRPARAKRPPTSS